MTGKTPAQSPLLSSRESGSFVKKSEHFISKIKNLESEQNDSFNSVSLFTNVPVDEAMSVLRKVLETDENFVE
jgi:hypothetical protein